MFLLGTFEIINPDFKNFKANTIFNRIFPKSNSDIIYRKIYFYEKLNRTPKGKITYYAPFPMEPCGCHLYMSESDELDGILYSLVFDFQTKKFYLALMSELERNKSLPPKITNKRTTGYKKVKINKPKESHSSKMNKGLVWDEKVNKHV